FTGKRVWSYQTVHHDLWDMDLPSQPSLVDLATSDGIIPAVVQPAKTGNLFVLDRRTGHVIAIDLFLVIAVVPIGIGDGIIGGRALELLFREIDDIAALRGLVFEQRPG